MCISEFCKERSDPRCGGGLFCAYHWAKQNPGIIPPPEEPGVGRYKMVVRNGTKITEHRWVMQVYLGRPLEPHENVHHINGMRDDNRLENLELWSVSQPAGQRIPDKVAWAKAILQQYEPSALA